VYCRVYSGTLCVPHNLESHCVFVCIAESREALCVLHSLEWHFVYTAQSREIWCVYCTVQSDCVCVLHSLERHCVCSAQSREALCVY